MTERRPEWQASLFIGVVISMFGTVAMVASSVVDNHDFVRWLRFAISCNFAGQALTTYGLFALAARLTGRARTLLQIAASLAALLLAWELARFALGLAAPDDNYDWFTWAYRAVELVTLAIVILVGLAARSWSRQPWAPILAILVVVLNVWTPVIGESLWDLYAKSHALYAVFWTLRQAIWVLCMLAMLHALVKAAAPIRPDIRTAVGAARRAAIALAMYGLALAVICVAVVAGVGGTLVNVTAPFVGAIALLGGAWAMLDLERARLPGMPNVRIAVGCTLTLWWAAAYAAITVARLADRERFGDSDAWVLVGPVMGLVGLACVGSAIASYAKQLSSSSLAQRNALFLTFSGVGIGWGLLQWSHEYSATMWLIGPGLLVAGIVVLASALRLLAATLDRYPTLPSARINSPAP